MPDNEEIAKLKDERIQLLMMLNRWANRGYSQLAILADQLDDELAKKIKELTDEKP